MPPFQPVAAKPDHVGLEHSTLERWERERTFEALRDRNRGNPPFSFIDGPITANNPMGVHHGWGRTLKDIWQRYRAMQGFDLLYQNGFDCQGLWVEVGVEKELGLNSKREIEEYGLERFARACRDREALEAVLLDLALRVEAELLLDPDLHPEPLAVEPVLVEQVEPLHGPIALPDVLERPAPAVVHAHGVVGRDRAVDEAERRGAAGPGSGRMGSAP